MKNENSIDNFFIDSQRTLPKNKGRKAPIIIKETREIVGTESGKSLELINCKACKITIDNKTYEEKDFKKLFPNVYTSFNIKRTHKNKELKDKTYFEEILYFYFPIQMLQEHNVKVICRKKMLEITYIL